MAKRTLGLKYVQEISWKKIYEKCHVYDKVK